MSRSAPSSQTCLASFQPLLLGQFGSALATSKLSSPSFTSGRDSTDNLKAVRSAPSITTFALRITFAIAPATAPGHDAEDDAHKKVGEGHSLRGLMQKQKPTLKLSKNRYITPQHVPRRDERSIGFKPSAVLLLLL